MYKIKVKRDFPCSYGKKGFLINGKWVDTGFVVTDGICNIMPGATWFLSIKEAMSALHIYCGVQGNSQEFWKEYTIKKA